VDPALRPAILHNLAVICEEQGRPEEARPLYEEALAQRERLLGPTHPGLRPTLFRLAQLHDTAGRPALAAPLYARALSLAEKELGEGHPLVAKMRAWLERLPASH